MDDETVARPTKTVANNPVQPTLTSEPKLVAEPEEKPSGWGSLGWMRGRIDNKTIKILWNNEK